MRFKSTLLLGIASLSVLALTACTPQTNTSAPSPKTETSSATTNQSNDNKILSDLVTYTTQQSAGPTKNYYYENGKSDKITPMAVGAYNFEADSQGRSAKAVATLTYGQFEASKGSRQGTPLDPPYWPRNSKVAITYGFNNRTYHGYMWNRSHSIADSLLGASSYDSVYNFTAGTRPQNVGANQKGGMRYAEALVENYWRANPGTDKTVAYQTTPVYNNNERIPRGSIVDIKSSDGTLDKEIVVINSAEGIDIDYK